MTFLWQSVESSVIKSFGYDTVENILVVHFNSNSVWLYIDVPFDVYAELSESKSKGKYFNLHIRNFYVSQKYVRDEHQKDLELLNAET